MQSGMGTSTCLLFKQELKGKVLSLPVVILFSIQLILELLLLGHLTDILKMSKGDQE